MSKFLSLLLVVLVGVQAFAQAPGKAVVYTSGIVLVNGKVAPATTALFQGDTLQTTNGASAVIVSPGSSVSVPENSQVQFQPKGIQVKSGAAAGGTAASSSSGTTQANAPLTLMSPGLQTIIPITGVCPNSIHCGFH